MVLFALKTIVAGVLIALASSVAGRKPVLAGFIIALPLTSIIAIIFSYLQYRDMVKINQFAQSIFVVVPLSLTFFVPFLLNRWLKLPFAATFLLALVCLALAYAVAVIKFKVVI